MRIDLKWFKANLIAQLEGCAFNYRSFVKGDFGSLDQVEIESFPIMATVDFWELNWLGVHVWHQEQEKDIINVLLEPNEEKKKSEVLSQLVDLMANR